MNFDFRIRTPVGATKVYFSSVPLKGESTLRVRCIRMSFRVDTSCPLSQDVQVRIAHIQNDTAEHHDGVGQIHVRPLQHIG